ncbi:MULTISPECIES: hypothetical protein [unclassified Pseudonocardia]|uniref:hypothetical protein n=1 Tax=unclassified Pseudonocardia TaxID=2619320 RepID=UPI00310199B3
MNVKKLVTLLVVALVVFFILTNPNGASNSVSNIGNILYNAAQSTTTFFTNLF